MDMPDIRWQQRFANFKKALVQLTDADTLSGQRALSGLEKQGLVQAFEFTYELAWNTLKDYLAFQGVVGLIGSRDTTREAFANGLIGDGEGWMHMLSDRNRSAHTYNQVVAEEIVSQIHALYVPLLRDLEARLQALVGAG